jgi:hypothetical protein
MRLLPFQRLELHVSRPPAEVQAALVRLVAPPKPFRLLRPGEPLARAVHGSEFRVWVPRALISWPRDCAVAEGAIEAAGTGSALRFRVVPDGNLTLMWSVWIGLLLMLDFGAAVAESQSPHGGRLVVGAFLVGAAVLLGSFALAARDLKRVLREVLGAIEAGPNRLVRGG